MKRPHEQFDSIIEKLKENWLTSEETLQGLSKEEWKDLGIPMALIKKIKEKITPKPKVEKK